MNNKLFTAILASWLTCGAQVVRAQEPKPSNFTSPEPACSHYDAMRTKVLGNIGVDTKGLPQDWTKAYDQAYRFWNNVLDAKFHTKDSLHSCAIHVSKGDLAFFKGPSLPFKDIFPEFFNELFPQFFAPFPPLPEFSNDTYIAISQFTDWDDFKGKIIVNPDTKGAQKKGAKKGSAKGSSNEDQGIITLTQRQMFFVAVHEIGHMLGLRHSANSRSIMYSYIAKDGDVQVLDKADLAVLAENHQLRSAAARTLARDYNTEIVVIPPARTLKRIAKAIYDLQ